MGGHAEPRRRIVRERLSETKAAPRTTEFLAYIIVLAALLIAGLIDDSEGGGGFGAQDVWLYATILTVGYMVSRGLAKSGSRESQDADRR